MLTPAVPLPLMTLDRKSTRLKSSHRCSSFAVFCLKKRNASSPPKAPTPRWHILNDRTADSAPPPPLELPKIAEEILWLRTNGLQLFFFFLLGRGRPIYRLFSPKELFPS